ncbi:hypothetical protein SAMN04487944_102152 [Gracilibacillus ureilyticus]|uniref:Uncharacterized protein n=1 Tax=Gracilibacillus ureilyticus TaxID=531814 RepID=A0A1H9MTF2_9BACI|nr:hypothetical protein [Gracilibacillus ureilyticus]SER26996.1 hypothetical protein SAMN04487944_102152 [Gracilibacillus ureilyticus]
MKHSYIFFTFVFLLHILNVLFPSDRLQYALGLLAFVMLLLSFRNASKLFKILGIAFTVVGLLFFLSTDLELMDIIPMLADNLSLLTLLAVLPWMNSAVTAGRFDKLMQTLLRGNVKHLGSLYQRSTTAMMSLTAFLNVSSATIAQDVLVDNLKPVKKKIANKFIMMTTLRGYSLALPWSPLEVLLAMSIFITGVNYGELLPWMIMITIFMYLIDSLWGRYYFGKIPYPEKNEAEAASKNIHIRSKILQLIIALVSFLALVILLGKLFDMEFIFVVTILVFPFAALWAVLIKRGKSFWTIGWNKWKNSVNNMHNFIVLFVTLAFFTGSLNESPALTMIQEPVLLVADYPILILIMIQLLFIFLSMFGVHPVATMGVLGGISPLLMDILSPLSLAIILVTASVSTIPVGTYGLVVTITSMSLKQSPYLITYYNLIYSFVFGTVGIIAAYWVI